MDVKLLALEIAAAAQCDPRSAEKAIRRGPGAVRGLAGERIARVMRARGVTAKEPPGAA